MPDARTGVILVNVLTLGISLSSIYKAPALNLYDTSGQTFSCTNVPDGQVVAFEWDTVSLVLQLSSSFVSPNGLRCMFNASMVSSHGDPGTVPAGEVRVIFEPEIGM